ncbi:D-alanyl-D-alanine carboxypeptidase [Cecembia calidifontis]|jgi:D-alanyl-D-alanine carboxypeptidase/D-alanyl-D-alanine-endopeptidase (penicillin-binding protein 4)|uniref:D-alanyl-D-alanine carboxypeptidase/D-alanyl-D-alanine-endopeptidase (Penicillin-binding protein 4) n=1 Tax=Cecembia calidifontis TaxID=1187080 RepID=A0A4V2F701_9BACT|nr:D-alanyl-D-alanine carboxypeptidase [Cecembia calidifontis]RZS98099.1 D-alanyl-D-alanine carboxypeptidase/D-alanyl-D-alanine-endopeptidase (penicillin-binding protein 4) [Cecembia calidifontis]
MKLRVIGIIFFWLLFLPGFSQEDDARRKYEGLNELLGENSFFDNHLTGFMLYDLDSQWVMFEKNSHMNFIPASTTKLLTFYASVLILKDSTRTFRYVKNGDQITIWGSGDPSWKYKPLPQPKLQEFFRPYKKINFSLENWKDTPFGYGWQWDDYYFAYSPERSAFPVYGNIVTFTNTNKTPVPDIPLFRSMVARSDREIRGVQRDFNSNTFYYNPSLYVNQFSTMPFITIPEVKLKLMEESLGKPVTLVREKAPADAKVYKGGLLAPLWKEVLQESDNFVAEQLLLMVSDALFGELNSERAIDFIKKNHMADFPDKPQWVDGSGLSRHNLVTPRSMVTLMVKLDQLMPRAQLMQLLPQGGVNGTLKNNYAAPRPYVFAKTGTISNNHSLVGLLRTDSGKVYAFSFMNNNYLNKASEIRREMEKVLKYIKANY